MKKYTIEEAIEDVAMSIQVMPDGYGTWKVSGQLGCNRDEECFKDYFITHDEEWKTGFFDGEEYNEYALSDEAREACERDGEDYDIWYDTVTHDGANEDNYESAEHRDRRAAEKFVDEWTDFANQPDRLYFNDKSEVIFLLTPEENDFLMENFDLIESLTAGDGKAFLAAFENREEN